MQCDIRKYFQSVDWDILLSIIGRTIHCPDTLKVIRTIVTSQNPLVVQKAEVGQQFSLLDVLLSTPSTVSVANRVGLPIGNLTSQLFANVYLNQLDHFVKDELGVRWYGRYMDDFLIIHPDKEYLKGIRHRIEDYLSNRLHLRLHPRKVSINNVSLGVPFVGYRIYYDHMVMRNSTLLHMQRRHSRQQQLVERGSMELERLLQMEQSIKGFCRHANAWGLGDKLWPNVVISDVEPVNDTK